MTDLDDTPLLREWWVPSEMRVHAHPYFQRLYMNVWKGDADSPAIVYVPRRHGMTMMRQFLHDQHAILDNPKEPHEDRA